MRYSYSAIKLWLTCPRQFEAKYITKTWPPFHETPATRRGKEAHRDLENYIRGQRDDVPKQWWTPPGLLEKLKRADARAEVRYTATIGGHEMIGYIDVEMSLPHRVLCIDWKVGKFYPDELQADVYGVLHRDKVGHPEKPFSFSWVYLDQQLTHTVEVDKHAQGRVVSLLDAVEADTAYDPKPCFACKWCPVVACEYNKSGERR